MGNETAAGRVRNVQQMGETVRRLDLRTRTR
jgi:hypothetical protein